MQLGEEESDDDEKNRDGVQNIGFKKYEFENVREEMSYWRRWSEICFSKQYTFAYNRESDVKFEFQMSCSLKFLFRIHGARCHENGFMNSDLCLEPNEMSRELNYVRERKPAGNIADLPFLFI